LGNYSSATTPFFLNLSIVITVFSLMIFIGQNFISQVILLYVQGLLDLCIISYLVMITGFFDSPYIVFYSIVIIYMCFFDGFKAGIFTIFIFLMTFSAFSITIYHKSNHVNINEFILRAFQYGFSFIIIVMLTSYLHKIYSVKNKEKEDIEERFKYLEKLYKSILDNIDIGIILMSKKGIIISCNIAGLKILGFSESIIGKKLSDILSIKAEDEIIIYKNKYLGYKFQPFVYDTNLSGELFIFQDVTEKENLKSKLHEQQRLAILGQFSTIIAHEIRNPLGAIKGSLQIIKKDEHPKSKLFNIMEREISRLDNILNNLLMVVKESKITNDKIDLNGTISEFIEEINYYGLFDDLKINYKCQANNPNVVISTVEVRQIIWNLIINSFQAKSDAIINITLKDVESSIVLVYEDNGPGISSEIADNVFKPFFTTKKSGTGLGLYVVNSICEKYDIKIKIYDISVTGVGFKLELHFP
jgi:two-component system sensor histidine kinase PilS (NtrC family)